MIHLSQIILSSNVDALTKDKVIRLSNNPDLPTPLRKKEIFIVQDNKIPEGFWGYLFFEGDTILNNEFKPRGFLVSQAMKYLSDGDIISITSNIKRIRALFRKKGKHNSLLLTERCNHYCLMCSQPPKKQDDSYLIEDIKDVLRLASRDCKEIGFTGGEPSLLGDDFIELVKLSESYLPQTALHVLTNGRAFVDYNFTKKLGKVMHHDIMLGVPIYSDVPEVHNYVVQADNAFDETIKGIINLDRCGVPIEIRVVLHKITVDRLINLAEFISKNLPFVSHVAFMGLEMTGFARANKNLLWIEPDAYAKNLQEAVLFLAKRNIRTSIYNLQLCLMPEKIWPFMRQSISDWKNEYEEECKSCDVQVSCGGFFSSFIHQKPKNIHAITAQ